MPPYQFRLNTPRWRRRKIDFEKAPKAFKDDVWPAIRTSSDVTMQAARAVVPVRTGQLRSWIKQHLRKDWLLGDVYMDKGTGTKEKQGDGEYNVDVIKKSQSVEYGREDRHKLDAQSFIRAAGHATNRRNKARISRAANKAIKKLAARINR